MEIIASLNLGSQLTTAASHLIDLQRQKRVV